ncbi:MAG: hypothetical protein E5V66_18410 [Mesorhizobium sp.]|nr:hypothetical protein EOA29_23815 [Mesorhizobium sp. M1E.F.Ca.ET.063.01.1.1]TIW10371.1 MAG: hypothetical protein E5V66_18410 [Mesorhizobium sp.]
MDPNSRILFATTWQSRPSSYVACKWALLYIERWLAAPMEKNGEVVERARGTPQRGVVTP